MRALGDYPPARLTRRQALAGFLGAGFLPALDRCAAARPAADLEVLVAPTGASITLERAFDSGALAASAPNASLRLWRDNDELRAGIVSGHARLFSTPTHVPANLANRGLPIRLLGLLGSGHLYVVTADESVAALKDLAGKPVLAFFRNDMPDLVFRACARMEGLDPDADLRLSYVPSGMEAGQMIASGRAPTAVLSEPMATAAIAMAAQQGRALRRAISLQEVWTAHRHGGGIPMVGVAVHASLVDESPEVIADLRRALPAAKAWALANRAEAGALAEKTMGMKAEIFVKAVDTMNLDYRDALSARRDLEDFYSTLLAGAPDALAGKLPDDAFYLGA
jgi:NitT/TauT family transport system substrate-binding protein